MDAQTRMRMLGLGHTKKPTKTGDFYQSSDTECKRALTKFGDARINVLPDRNLKSARTIECNVKRGAIVYVRDALTHPFTTDAHLQTCIVDALINDDMSPRVAKEALKLGAQIELLSFDFDLSSHGTARMTDDLFTEIVNQMVSSPVLSNAVFYSTRGGLRALIPLNKPFHISSDTGADWTAFYNHIVRKLPTSTHGEWDASCGDTSRLFRLPRVVRENETQTGMIYVPQVVTAYSLNREDHEIILNACITKNMASSAIEGNGLIDFFSSIGKLGEQHTDINGYPSYIVECPFAEKHSSSNPTSTIIMATEQGAYTLHCLHNSCKPYTQNGAWKRHLQATFAEDWDDCIGVEGSEFVYNPVNPNEFVKNAGIVLDATFPDRIFRKHDDIVTVERDAWGGATWSTWSAEDLTGLLNRSASWVTKQLDKEGREITRPTSVPVKIVREQKRAIRDALPICEQRTVLPPLDPETLLPTRFSEGYCHITQSYFLPHPSLDLNALKRACEQEPSRDRALTSYIKLTDLYMDFPWRSEAHRALAVGATMTAVLRRAVDVAPLFFVSANNKGVGKTKLLSSVLASVYGETPPLSALPERSDELKKTLDSIVASNVDYYVFDNVSGKIGGAELDGFITSARHQYRPLGTSQVRAGRQTTFLGATGNNATINGDTDRRSIIMRLVTPLENPEMRTGFRYRDLIGEAKKRVTETWIAVIEILQAYRHLVTAEERRHINATSRQLGSFEQWCDNVRNPLMWVASLVNGADVDIVKLSADEMEDAKGDDRTELFTALIEWQANRDRIAKKRGVEWTSKSFADALRTAVNNESGCYLDDFGSTLSSYSVQYVARVLSARRDQISQGYRLESRRLGGKMLWVMNCVDPSESPEPPNNPPTPRESLPIIAENETCDAKTCHDVPSALLAENNAYEPLARRCIHLRGDMCAKFKIECDYDGSNGGINETVSNALRAGIEDELEKLRNPVLPMVTEVQDDKRALQIVMNEVAVKTNQSQIAIRLNAEMIPPPRGRKWTSAKVGQFIKRNQIEKPTVQKRSKSEIIVEREGHWENYWSEEHPLTQPVCTEKTTVDLEQRGTMLSDASMILTRVYGRVMNCRTAFTQRVTRDEAEHE